MTAITKNQQLQAIFSQETTSTSLLQSPTHTEQLSEANKGDSLASETVVSQSEATKITSLEEPQLETLDTSNQGANSFKKI